MSYKQSDALIRDHNFAQTFVDHNHKVVYCGIQKAAATTWMRIIGGINGINQPYTILQTDLLRKHNLVPLYKYNQKEQAKILNEYTSFMMVRDPIQRVYSAYKNKFLGRSCHEQMHQFKYGRDIARLYRMNTSSIQSGRKRYGYDVSLTDFIRYITDEKVPDLYKVNIHWTPYYSLCPVCSDFQPDFILKQESFDSDVFWILKLLFKTDPKRYLKVRANVSKKGKTDDKISEDLFAKLLKHYETDRQLFMYD